MATDVNLNMIHCVSRFMNQVHCQVNLVDSLMRNFIIDIISVGFERNHRASRKKSGEVPNIICFASSCVLHFINIEL